MSYDYGADVAPTGDNSLQAVDVLAREQLAAELEVEACEEALKLAKAALEQIKNRRFPDLMVELGQKLLKTTSGLVVELNDIVRASIPEARRPEAHAWLDEHGHGDVVKMSLSLELGKGAPAKDKLTQIQEFCANLNVPANAKESVHPQTLGALVRTLLSSGVEFDQPMFGVFVSKETKVKPAKK